MRAAGGVSASVALKISESGYLRGAPPFFGCWVFFFFNPSALSAVKKDNWAVCVCIAVVTAVRWRSDRNTGIESSVGAPEWLRDSAVHQWLRAESAERRRERAGAHGAVPGSAGCNAGAGALKLRILCTVQHRVAIFCLIFFLVRLLDAQMLIWDLEIYGFLLRACFSRTASICKAFAFFSEAVIDDS